MTEPSFLDTPNGRRIAYHHVPGRGPTVVFLGGFRSDMEGTKAIHLDSWAKVRGQAFVRLDYSGHGQSSGDFLDGSIGAWAMDAQAVISEVVAGPVVLVGSSMGGWIALILCRRLTGRIAGLVGIAAAPDFTEDSMWAGMDDAQREALMSSGQIEVPSDYSEEPYVITRKLIQEGRGQLVLRAPLDLPFRTRFLQGTADTDVDMSVALRLLRHASGTDMRLTLVKDADHRFSTPDCLALITASIEEVLEASDGAEG